MHIKSSVLRVKIIITKDLIKILSCIIKDIKNDFNQSFDGGYNGYNAINHGRAQVVFLK